MNYLLFPTIILSVLTAVTEARPTRHYTPRQAPAPTDVCGAVWYNKPVLGLYNDPYFDSELVTNGCSNFPIKVAFARHSGLPGACNICEFFSNNDCGGDVVQTISSEKNLDIAQGVVVPQAQSYKCRISLQDE
ncbi:hypothetical protein BU24DRAFT_493556 [Aaosphaeria arxii CBS 175.79]|uniref:Uncharacterized protein n=1 Tax=Aaosphaeria arxii CBS 175.79 TaxID=1450172 RepID=A0A6A5XPM1_9PLEO|nr:uncharacterized protein BU24DRAFT_493556 [Aaosphaeria arxii CBS 175.79]KAF2015092.1 hypothetical protein BU24DRAFT_493556 [Aaosphaeria arxii CBS 175.79]